MISDLIFQVKFRLQENGKKSTFQILKIQIKEKIEVKLQSRK